MMHTRRWTGFTLIELLVVILILAVLMAIALPLYLRAVRDSERQTCRSNMQTIANAEQAYRVRTPGHSYTEDLTLLTAADQDLQALPRCPSDSGTAVDDDYIVTINADGTITVQCNSDNLAEATFHNTITPAPLDGHTGFIPGVDAQ